MKEYLKITEAICRNVNPKYGFSIYSPELAMYGIKECEGIFDKDEHINMIKELDIKKGTRFKVGIREAISSTESKIGSNYVIDIIKKLD